MSEQAVSGPGRRTHSAPGPASTSGGKPGPDPGDDGARVFECFDCGQFHRLSALPAGAEARCRRCHSVLQRRKTDPMRRTLAWCLAALAALAVAVSLPFMDIDLYGRTNHIVLGSGPTQLNRDGMWELAWLVGFFTMAAPTARMGGLAAVLIGLQRRARPPRILFEVLRIAQQLRVWSMLEVFLLGAFVAYTKLVDLAHVDVLVAGYALGGFMLLQAMTESSFDAEITWQALEARGLVADPPRLASTLAELGQRKAVPAGLIACETCGFCFRGASGTRCARCGAKVHARKPDAIVRCWALLSAAAILYIPANLFPVLTAIKLGNGEPSTILGGVRQLAQAGMYPLAILVFFASITVPAVKLIGLVIVLVSTRTRAHGWLRDRTTLFRIVESIGRWSMIDVFMLSILVGLVRLGFVASVTPGYGAVAFAGVVVLTMFASMAFDPRLMWDAALEKTR